MKTVARLCVALLVCFLSGCAIVGAIYNKTVTPHGAPVYKGLVGHTVGVMVWADRSVRIDWNSVQVDLAGALEQYLKASGAKEISGATFPVRPASIVRYQQDHPADELLDVTDIAPKLGVERLIYIELNQLATRSPTSVELFRGAASVNLKVVEVSGGSARVAYEEHDIRAVFPKHTTTDGTLNGDDSKMYRGVINLMAQKLGDKFVTHPAENDEPDPITDR